MLHYLTLAKVVLEGRGFQPNFLIIFFDKKPRAGDRLFNYCYKLKYFPQVVFLVGWYWQGRYKI
jgi:hypothetical protein